MMHMDPPLGTISTYYYDDKYCLPKAFHKKTGINVFCIPVCCELDLKKAAKAAGDKNMELVAVKELLGLTGYIRGGCSPVGMKKHYPTFIDETCTLWDEIAVSAGARGHQMIVPPQPLAELVGAELTDIIV
mgnify:CR=1 FL=1